MKDARLKRIQLHKQQYDYDCGHTCLRMFGYDAYRMFPAKRPLNTSHYDLITGSRRISMTVGEDNSLDFDTPDGGYIIGFTPKGMTLWDAGHWVVRDREHIYCPRVGKMSVQQYRHRYIGTVTFGDILQFQGMDCPPQLAKIVLLGVTQAIYIPFH